VLLSNRTGRQVVDHTGFTGTFDVQFPFAPLTPETGAGAAPPDGSAPSFFTALQEQLGLKLEATRGPVEVLVIDTISEPTPN